MLEARLHAHNSFLTLTYDDDHCPRNGSLVPRDLKLFTMRLRTARGPFRYFSVGEYGDITQRPHYHAILFGVSPDELSTVKAVWPAGKRVTLDPLTVERAGYCAGYVTKKMTKKDDERLNGRHPEFARMSLKPGIGADAIPQIAHTFLTNSVAADYLKKEGDVPVFLKTAGRSFPIGRYLRSRLQNELGFSQTVSAKLGRLKTQHEKNVSDLRYLQENSLDFENDVASYWAQKGFVRDPEKVDQMVLNLNGRLSIKKRKTL